MKEILLTTIAERALILCHKISVTKLRASSYGLPVTVITAKEETVKSN